MLQNVCGFSELAGWTPCTLFLFGHIHDNSSYTKLGSIFILQNFCGFSELTVALLIKFWIFMGCGGSVGQVKIVVDFLELAG
jgi:hypothetical protein